MPVVISQDGDNEEVKSVISHFKVKKRMLLDSSTAEPTMVS